MWIYTLNILRCFCSILPLSCAVMLNWLFNLLSAVQLSLAVLILGPGSLVQSSPHVTVGVEFYMFSQRFSVFLLKTWQLEDYSN